ncbi:MAG: glucose-1-phosphate adenylyltransferase subunit GlgD [Clostridia bacterium]
MRSSSVLGIIYSNLHDSYLSELTNMRTMGSVPFGGRYRLIDFTLSSMVNCGITTVGISTKSNYQSLMDHLGSGKAWDLSRKNSGITILPPFNLNHDGGMYTSRIEALHCIDTYIKNADKEYIIMTDCNVVTNIDYGTIIDEHIASGADMTIAYKHGKCPNIKKATTFSFDGDKITGLQVGAAQGEEADFSLNIMVVKRVVLQRLVAESMSVGDTEFEKELIGKNLDKLYIRGHEVKEYATVIDSLQSYYDISMNLLAGDYKALFSPAPIYTKVRDDMPAIYGLNATAKNCLVADGCIIKGEVENCILFRGVCIEEGAVVKNSIIMQDSYISAGAKLNCTILDKEVVIKPNRELSGAPTYPTFIGKGITV